MKNIYQILQLLLMSILVALLSNCSNSKSELEQPLSFESKIFSHLIDSLDIKDSTLFLQNIQGEFVAGVMDNDSLYVVYTSGVVVTVQHKDETQFKVIKKNLVILLKNSEFKNIHDSLLNSKIKNINLYKIHDYKDCFYQHQNKIDYLIDWNYLNNKGINNIYSMSEVFNDSTSLIAIQNYTKDYLETFYFHMNSKNKITRLKSDKYEICGYKCIYKNDSLINFKPICRTLYKE